VCIIYYDIAEKLTKLIKESIVYPEVALGAFSFPFSCREEAVVMTASVLEVVPEVAFGLPGAEESLAASLVCTSMVAVL